MFYVDCSILKIRPSHKKTNNKTANSYNYCTADQGLKQQEEYKQFLTKQYM